jgi:hypothetical protein
LKNDLVDRILRCLFLHHLRTPTNGVQSFSGTSAETIQLTTKIKGIQMKAENVQPGSVVMDRDGEELRVSEVWPNQGLGLGCVLVGNTVADDKHKTVRYVDVTEDVRIISKP